jgi:Acetyltransferase (GNAT) domain
MDVETREFTALNCGDVQPRLAVLAENLAETAGYANLHMIVAMLGHSGKSTLRIVEQEGELVLVASLIKRWFPVPHWRSWITPLTSSGQLSFTQSRSKNAFKSLINSTNIPTFLTEIPAESISFTELKSASHHFEILSEWQRAALKTIGTFEAWLADNFDHKRRKELKRLRARLGEQGALVSERLGTATLNSFIDDFLRLESGGWKGERGSALNQSPGMAEALRESLTALHATGKLRFWRTTLDGKAIAALFAIVENGQATLGKIAFDEAWAKYSPGVLVILDATADFFADPAIHLADSNAIPDHPMINRIWRDRITMANIMVAGPATSRLRFQATLTAEKLRVSLRNRAKSVYQRYKGK